jgi:hypothetical protein
MGVQTMSIYVHGELAESLADRQPVELAQYAKAARPAALRLGPQGGFCTVVRLTPATPSDGCVVLGARDLARLLVAAAGEDRAVELLIEEMVPQAPSPAWGF